MLTLRLSLAAGLAALSAGIASAKEPAFPVQGPDCNAMVARYGPRGLWIGQFAGGREVDLFGDATRIQSHAAQACFRTQRQCDQWLYALNTQFQDWPQLSVCQPLRG